MKVLRSLKESLNDSTVSVDLDKLKNECCTENWDGYGAAPILPETIEQAKRLIEALPANVSAPTVGAEPDGHVTLEWHRSQQLTFSVSVTPDGELHYAALFGKRKMYGTEPFTDDIPAILLDLIVGWPIDKPAQKMFALQIAAESAYVPKPHYGTLVRKPDA